MTEEYRPTPQLPPTKGGRSLVIGAGLLLGLPFLWPLLVEGGGAVPLAVVIVAISVWQIALGITLLRKAARLRASSALAEGVVTARWRSARQAWIPCIAYRFVAELPDAERELIQHAEYNPDLYYMLRVGDKVPVRYHPPEPDICLIDAEIIEE